jgi:hypothetical protein
MVGKKGKLKETVGVFKIDVDKKELSEFKERYAMLCRYFKPKLISYDVKETRKGYHIRLILSFPFKLSRYEFVLIQSLLGSDWKREMLNYFRVKNGLKDWNILFNKKYRIYIKENNKINKKNQLEVLRNKINIRRVSYER